MFRVASGLKWLASWLWREASRLLQGLQVDFSYMQFPFFQIEVICTVYSSVCLLDGAGGLLVDCCGKLLENFGLQVSFTYIQFCFVHIKVICAVYSSESLVDGAGGLLVDCGGKLLVCFGLQVNFTYIQFSFFQIEVICKV